MGSVEQCQSVIRSRLFRGTRAVFTIGAYSGLHRQRLHHTPSSAGEIWQLA